MTSPVYIELISKFPLVSKMMIRQNLNTADSSKKFNKDQPVESQNGFAADNNTQFN